MLRNLTGMARLAYEIELRVLSDQPTTRFTSVSSRILLGLSKDSKDALI